MTARRDDLTGIDDFLAQQALARCSLLRQLVGQSLPAYGHRFMPPRRPTAYDALGYLVIDTCTCRRPSGHDHGCLYTYDLERAVYRVDYGREHYATVPLR